MEIRLLVPEDRDSFEDACRRIAQLFHDTVREVNIRDYSAEQVQAWAPENLYFRDWVKICSNRFTYIAEDAEEIIGFAELETSGHIGCFYCHKDYQRRGVGTRLYQTIEAKAVELGINRIYTEASITARAFFKSRGFAVVKEQQVVVRGARFTNFAMEKNLNISDRIAIANFYHFTDLVNYQELRPLLKSLGDRHQLKGTILLAPEGINATIAGSREGIDIFLNYLRSLPSLENLEHKKSYSHVLPLNKLRVKLKKELVKFGISDIDPTRDVGVYVEPKDWNDLISDPNVLVIDTRNIYEVEFGTFTGAINPNLDFFSEFPKYVEEHLSNPHQAIAMFCTGGIRCEKASAYMLARGFSEVYHLKGGILKYLEEVPRDASLWQGECFIFDDRITVNIPENLQTNPNSQV
jgi:UPF0176 protein